MKKPLYELNLPPAAFFIGQYVKVITKLEERNSDGESTGALTVVGMVVESDPTYLTLGTFSELEQTPIPAMAIKHDDIYIIRVIDTDEIDIDTLQTSSNSLN